MTTHPEHAAGKKGGNKIISENKTLTLSIQQSTCTIISQSNTQCALNKEQDGYNNPETICSLFTLNNSTGTRR